MLRPYFLTVVKSSAGYTPRWKLFFVVSLVAGRGEGRTGRLLSRTGSCESNIGTVLKEVGQQALVMLRLGGCCDPAGGLGEGDWSRLTNSATSFALPFNDSLCTLDLSFSGAAAAIFPVLWCGAAVDEVTESVGNCRESAGFDTLFTPAFFRLGGGASTVVRGCGVLDFKGHRQASALKSAANKWRPLTHVSFLRRQHRIFVVVYEVLGLSTFYLAMIEIILNSSDRGFQSRLP